jgi:hypothetical protein
MSEEQTDSRQSISLTSKSQMRLNSCDFTCIYMATNQALTLSVLPDPKTQIGGRKLQDVGQKTESEFILSPTTDNESLQMAEPTFFLVGLTRV